MYADISAPIRLVAKNLSTIANYTQGALISQSLEHGLKGQTPYKPFSCSHALNLRRKISRVRRPEVHDRHDAQDRVPPEAVSQPRHRGRRRRRSCNDRGLRSGKCFGTTDFMVPINFCKRPQAKDQGMTLVVLLVLLVVVHHLVHFLIKRKKFSLTGNQIGVLQLPSKALYPLSYSHIVTQVVKNYLFNLRI